MSDLFDLKPKPKARFCVNHKNCHFSEKPKNKKNKNQKTKNKKDEFFSVWK
jgi:hypothetical protein